MTERITNARLEAFCDGIFAIAITLLILEIKIPEIENIHSISDIKKAIFSQWPSWLAFSLTFITLFITWVNHHNGLKQIDKTSNFFIYANGLLMLTVVIFPFSTGVLGRFLATEFSTLPVVLYCATNLLHALAWFVVACSAIYPTDLTKNSFCLGKVKKSKQLMIISCLFNLLVTILAFWYPILALSLVAAAWLTYSIVGIIVTTLESKKTT